MKTSTRILNATLACALLSLTASASAQEAPATDAEQQAMMAEHFAGTWDTTPTIT